MAIKRLVESFAKDWDYQESTRIKKIPLTESNNKIITEGKEFIVYGGYLIPVWILDTKNKNDRTYTSELARKIVREDLVTLALKDHPKDDGSVDNIVSVSKNPFIKNGILWVSTFFVDEEFEKKVEKIRLHGGKIGVSSSGLGEVDDDGFVIAETFELERYLDWVLDPSYGVFLDSTNEKIQDSTITESTVTTSTITESTITDTTDTTKINESNNEKNIDLITEENNMVNENMFYEKSTRLNIKSQLEAIDKQTDLSIRNETLKELLECVSDTFLPDVKKSIEEKISLTNQEIVLKIQESQVILKEKTELEKTNISLKESTSTIEKKYNKVVSLLEGTREYTKKLNNLLESQIAKNNSMIQAKDYAEVVEYTEAVELKVEEQKIEIKELTKKVEESTREIESLKKLNKKLKESANEKAELNLAIANSRVSAKDYSDLVRKSGELERKLSLSKKVEKTSNDEDKRLYDKIDDEDDMEDDDNYEVEDDDSSIDDDYDDNDNASLAVKNYYSDLVSENRRYESIKREVLKCRTVLEAQKTVLSLKELVEGDRPRNTGKQQRLSQYNDIKESSAPREVDAGLVKRSGWL